MENNKHLSLLSDQVGVMYHYYYQFKSNLYGDNSMEKRKSLGQFYTPPQLSSKMLEKYDTDLNEFRSKTILDPTCGSGLLLIDALIAGSDPDKVFGIELDEEVLGLAHDRLCNEKNPVLVPDLDYSDPENVKTKPYVEGDKFIEIPDAEYSTEDGITYDGQEKYDVSKLWGEDGKIKDGIKTRKVKVKEVVIPKYNIHHGNALNNDCYIFPESKYETDMHKGKKYKFNKDEGTTGKVDFIDESGKTSFRFGGF